MIPAISHILGVEMIRDSGSLAACFRGSDGSEYWLMFPVDPASDVSGLSEWRDYLAPVVIDRLCGTAFAITWTHAQVLLDQVEAFPLDEPSQRWLRIMRDIATAEGVAFAQD